ncbi:MAG: C4-dicarboxylate transporter DctA [Polyangiaceae bacterium]
MTSEAPQEKAAKNTLYLQVLGGIALGVLLGVVAPEFSSKLEPASKGFVRLIKMLVAPLVFSTVVVGIAKAGDLKRVGRIGVKALIYFELLTTVALFIGLGVMHIVSPGKGLNVDPAKLDASKLEKYRKPAQSTAEFLLDIVPENVLGAFAEGKILGVLLFAVLFGMALSRMEKKAAPLVDVLDRFASALFGVVALIMKLAPFGAFAAMAFTVSTYGVSSLANLGGLMAAFYVTGLLFVIVVLGSITRLLGLSPVRLFLYIKDEVLLVLGTSSSESALPRLLAKLEGLGCEKSVVGLVVPTGYSFNLDGTCIYLTMAVLFLAQATNTPLTVGAELGVLGVLLVSSKGAAAVTGGGFITLVATLESTRTVPVEAIALLLGIDRFMSEARAIINLLGNAVATLVVARWERALDREKALAVLSGAAAATEAPREAPRAA